MKKWVSGFCAAFSMYSTVPMPQVPWHADTMRYLFCFFPWVGLLIGGLCLGWAWLCRAWHAGEMLFAGGMTLLPLIVSGGIHLDGMVDTADALYSRRETEKKLEILKDPHVGAFGVIVCGGYLLASFALWGQLHTSPRLLVPCCAGFFLSRCCSAMAVVSFPAAKNSGLAHFLSISGLHMSMLAGLMFFLVRLLLALIPPLALCYDSKKTAAVFAILMSAVYLVISGAEIPSQRAFIMTFIVLLGVLFARKAISMRMISWAALIVLVISPQALISASFQMSFAAVAALIAFYERFAGGLHRFLNGHENAEISLPSKVVRIVFAYVAGILVSDLVASLATLPFSIYHFNQIAVYTTFGNLLAGPVIGLIIMPFVLIALLLMPFNMEVWALKIVGFGVEKVNEITAYVASLPEAGYRVAAMPFWGLMLIVFGGLWLCIWRLKWCRWGWVLILAGSLSIFTVRIPDVMADKYGEVFAVKDEQGRLVILPSRGNAFTKKIWLEKTANRKLSAKESRKLKDIYDGKKTDRSWIDMECDERVCVYKDAVVIVKFGGIEIGERDFDLYAAEGAQFFVNGHGKVQAETVRSYIGRRPWN